MITSRDRSRAARVDRVPGGPHKVLELGAGFGGAAAATADLGHEVVGVERSPERAALARRHTPQNRAGKLEIVEADFETVHLPRTFDLVTFWRGFGMGHDDAQKCLLRRMHQWLHRGGRVLMDVFDPAWWAAHDGQVRVANGFGQRLGFDASTSRLLVTYWLDERPGSSTTESIRCYTPAEIVELIRGTGLTAHRPVGHGAFDVSFVVELSAE